MFKDYVYCVKNRLIINIYILKKSAHNADYVISDIIIIYILNWFYTAFYIGINVINKKIFLFKAISDKSHEPSKRILQGDKKWYLKFSIPCGRF